MATQNRSVRDHLRRIIDGERSRTARFLVLLRAFVTVLYLAVATYLGVVAGLPDWRETLWLLTFYAVVSLSVAVTVLAAPKTLRFVGLMVAFLDMPMVCAVSLGSLKAMDKPEYLAGSLLPFATMAVVLAALSLDYLSIGATTVVASACAWVLIDALHAPLSELTAPLFAIVSTGVLCAFLVSRLRALVEESRRKDFGGKYVLGDRIGAGGMAEVFTAMYSPEGGFERRVAVKRVLPSYANDESFVALFRREAELGAQLAHPNLVQVLDFGRHIDSWFLAMEYIDGVALSALVKAYQAREQPLPVSACLYVITEIAEGLAYLHEKRSQDGTTVGLVHRDLNPPNVLLSKAGEVKISDFGVARWQSTSALTQTGATRGKIAYMPPEQMEGGVPSPSWDLFALGVTAHELLCGDRLFQGDNESQVLQAVLQQPILPPSVKRPGLAPEVDALVLALLERKAEHRLPSARLVASRLRALEGVDAPFPKGQQVLVEAIATVEAAPPAQMPSAKTPLARDAATVTVNR